MRFLISVLVLSSSLFALPVGNPAEASLYKKGVFFDPCRVSPCSPLMMFTGCLDFRMGYWGDFSHRRTKEYFFGDFQQAEATTFVNTNAAYTVLNIYHWMDVFATFGVSNIKVKRTAKETNRYGIISYSPAFSWSVGTHATLYRNGPIYLGGMGQYFRTQPTLSTHYSYRSGRLVGFSNTNPGIMAEWQVAFGGALDLANALGTALVPYSAIKISQGDFERRAVRFNNDDLDMRTPGLESTKYLGWALGCTWLCQEAMSVTVEGRWVDETGIFVNGQMRFLKKQGLYSTSFHRTKIHLICPSDWQCHEPSSLR